MNISIKMITASIIVAGVLTISCTNASDKSAKMEDEKMEVKSVSENEVYKEDMEAYRIITAEKIAANEKSIVEFNARVATQKKEVKVDYQKRILELESKNSDMKKKMDDFNTDNKANWESFKADFSSEMDKLGQSIRDFSEKMVK